MIFQKQSKSAVIKTAVIKTAVKKSAKRNHFTGSIFVLSFILAGCGSHGNESEQLPNARVAVETTAAEAVKTPRGTATHHHKEESAEAANPLVGTSDRTLIANATKLAGLSETDYLALQKKWIGSVEEACNFFVITALCESGYCKKDKPFYLAADFDDYFLQTGWKEVSLADAKAYLKIQVGFDIAAQRGPLAGGSMGHIGIPISVNQDGSLLVAQGNYHKSSHQAEVWNDRFATPFHYFVNFASAASQSASVAPSGVPENAVTADPSSRAELYTATYYNVAEEENDPESAKTISMFDSQNGSLIAKISEKFRRDLAMEGAGKLQNGKTVNYVGAKAGGISCAIIDAEWGLGVRGQALIPFRSIAVDPSVIPLGKHVYIAETKGLALPDGSTHDGYWDAVDIGGGIRGRHIDFFVGESSAGQILEKAGIAGIVKLTVSFD